MVVINAFRVLADLSHTASKLILIWAIHSNKSAEGVSLITQVLYVVVFLSRYTEDIFHGLEGDQELFEEGHALRLTVFCMKLFYIFTSIYIIFVMLRLYARTREREKAWRFGAMCAAGSLGAAPFVMMIFEPKGRWRFGEMVWAFSIILESVCVLPQLLLLRQTTVPTVIDSYYLVTLGSYRAFYIVNWIIRATQEIPAGPNHRAYFDWIGPVFGLVQTAFYIDFAWVYYSRQRVKLRNGGVVDSEDLGRGWLVGKLTGRMVPRDENGSEGYNGGIEDGRSRPASGAPNRWGARGISVSADEEAEPLRSDEDGGMPHPDDFD